MDSYKENEEEDWEKDSFISKLQCNESEPVPIDEEAFINLFLTKLFVGLPDMLQNYDLDIDALHDLADLILECPIIISKSTFLDVALRILHFHNNFLLIGAFLNIYHLEAADMNCINDYILMHIEEHFTHNFLKLEYFVLQEKQFLDLQTRRILNIVYNKLLCIKEEELDEYVHKIVIQTFSKYIGHFQRQSFLSSYFSSKSLFTINTYKLLAFTIFNKFFSINEIEEIYDYCVRRNDLTMKSRHQAIVIIINFIKSSNQTKLETLVKQASPSFTDIVHFIFECKTFSKSYLLSYFEHSRIFMEFLADQNIIRRQEDCCSIAHQVQL